MSANRAVIVLRSPSMVAEASICCCVAPIGAAVDLDITVLGPPAVSELPQSPQNLEVLGFSIPQLGHSSGSAAPHCEQNLFGSGFCVPHCEQCMAGPLIRSAEIK
jgi:hypothetical protein